VAVKKPTLKGAAFVADARPNISTLIRAVFPFSEVVRVLSKIHHGFNLPFLLFVLLSSAFAGNSVRAGEISVVGLFKNQAVVRFGSQLQTLKMGEAHASGLRLVSVSSGEALIEYQGQARRYPMGRDYSGGYKARTQAQASIPLSDRGQYLTAGSINGRPVDFLLDTGANTMALSSNHAKSLGIDYKWTGQPSTVVTAQGKAKAWQVTLNKVKVGDIEQHQVPAVVIEGGFPVHVLLGMSFLSRVKMVENQGVITLLQKF
jgi:aspartyl protease family protein